MTINTDNFFILQLTVKPLTKGFKFPPMEIKFLLDNFRPALNDKITIGAIVDMLDQNHSVATYAERKWPDIDMQFRVRRIRDLLKKYWTK